MITKLSHLSPRQCEIPEEIIAAMVKAVYPEKIICYGARTKVLEAWSCFLYPIEAQIFTVYDLLIITRENEKKNSHEILDMIDCCNTPVITITALVHSIKAVNDALKNGSVFFTTLYQTGVLLYDNNALIRVITGYRPSTHNLGRLLAMIGNFSPFLLAVFPKNTKEEMDLFNTLTKAYSDARYKEGFKVTAEKVTILIERVTAFQCHAERLYRNKLREIKNGSTISTSHHPPKNLTYENC